MSASAQEDVPLGARPVQRPRNIRALTGIRIVAAVWVVFFHIRGNIASEFPALDPYIAPLIAHGEMGVDLFFALSGFVLCLNYVDRLGGSFRRSAAATFWWARLARVWPVFVLTLLAAGLWHGVLMAAGSGDPVPPREFSVPSFFRQALLIALWTEPDTDRLMWNGPAWSVSAEAFAYALFPVLVLLLFRLGRTSGSRALALLAFVSVLPVSLFVGAFGTLYVPWGWMLRIVCGFMGGALMYLAVRRIERTPRVKRLAGWGALAMVVLGVVGLYVSERLGYGHLAPMVAPFFVLLIGLLALGEGSIVTFLSTRWMVIGGAASYSVYMVHMLCIEPFWWLQGRFAAFAPGTAGSKLGFVMLPFVVVAVGYAVWRWFEEPVRERMRRMSIPRAGDDVSLVSRPLNQPALVADRQEQPRER